MTLIGGPLYKRAADFVDATQLTSSTYL